jgi:beta-lactamase regulating signal transducer with metallopeptidase domain
MQERPASNDLTSRNQLSSSTRFVDQHDEKSYYAPAAAITPIAKARPAKTGTSTLLSSFAALPSANVYDAGVSLWAGGIAVCFSWLLWCVVRVWQLRRTSTRLQQGAWHDSLNELSQTMQVRPPLLLCSSQTQSPLLCGWWRPAIVLPTDEDFDASARRAILLHELSHLRSRDLWWNLLSRFCCAALWPQPMLWIACRNLERTNEEVCDRAVIETGCSPQQYARCLLNLAERLTLNRTQRTVATGVVPLRSALARRVQHILDESKRGTMKISGVVRVAVVASTLLVTLAVVNLIAVRGTSPKPTSSTQTVDLSSPEATVHSFVNAINNGSLEQAAVCVQGGLPILNPNLKMNFGSERSRGSYRVLSLKTEQRGDKASVRLQAHVPWKSDVSTNEDRKESANLRLIRQNGSWKLARPFIEYSRNDRSYLQSQIETIAPAYREKLQQWATKKGTATITGRFVYEDGRPASNVTGTAYSESTLAVLRNIGGWPYRTFNNLPTSVHNLFLQRFTTDEAGDFKFRV